MAEFKDVADEDEVDDFRWSIGVVVEYSRVLDLLGWDWTVTDPSDCRLPTLLSKLGFDGSRFGLARRK